MKTFYPADAAARETSTAPARASSVRAGDTSGSC